MSTVAYSVLSARLELCLAMGRRLAAGDHSSSDHRAILDRCRTNCSLDHHLLPCHHPRERECRRPITAKSRLTCMDQVFGTLGYAEEEFWSSILKLVVVIMFVIAAIVFVCGGGPSNGEYSSYVGGRNWQNPGAFANGFKGVWLPVSSSYALCSDSSPLQASAVCLLPPPSPLPAPSLSVSPLPRPRTRARPCPALSRAQSGV